MFRKLVLAATAAASLGAMALSATPASAYTWHKGGFYPGYHHGFGWGWGGYYTGVGYDSCLRQVWRVNRFGEPVLRTVNICD